MIDTAGLNTGIAEVFSSSAGSIPTMTYVPGFGRINSGAGVFKLWETEQEPQPANKRTDTEEQNNPKLNRLMDVCRDFEAIFLYQLFRIMRESGPKSDLLDSGFASELYRDMLDEQLATELSKTGDFGLADILYEQMRDDVLARSSDDNTTAKAE